jgi:hypothetical protein
VLLIGSPCLRHCVHGDSIPVLLVQVLAGLEERLRVLQARPFWRMIGSPWAQALGTATQ